MENQGTFIHEQKSDSHISEFFHVEKNKSSFDIGIEDHALKLIIGERAPSCLTWGEISMKNMNKIDEDDNCLYGNVHYTSSEVIKNSLDDIGHEFLNTKYIIDIGSGNGTVSCRQYAHIDSYLTQHLYVGEKITVYCYEQNAYQLGNFKNEAKNYHYDHLDLVFVPESYKGFDKSGKKIFLMTNVIQNLNDEEMIILNNQISHDMGESDAFFQIYFEKNEKNQGRSLFTILKENSHRDTEILSNLIDEKALKNEIKNGGGFDVVYHDSFIVIYSKISGNELKRIYKGSRESAMFGKNWLDRFGRNLYGDEKSLYERARKTVSEYYQIDENLIRPGIIKTGNSWRIDIWPEDFKFDVDFSQIYGPFPLYQEKRKKPSLFSSSKKNKLQLKIPDSTGDYMLLNFKKPFNFLESKRYDKEIIDFIYRSINQKTVKKFNQGVVTLTYSKKGKFCDDYDIKNQGDPIVDTLLLPYWKNNNPFDKLQTPFSDFLKKVDRFADRIWRIIRI